MASLTTRAEAAAASGDAVRGWEAILALQEGTS
jgi:hypothetical protein